MAEGPTSTNPATIECDEAGVRWTRTSWRRAGSQPWADVCYVLEVPPAVHWLDRRGRRLESTMLETEERSRVAAAWRARLLAEARRQGELVRRVARPLIDRSPFRQLLGASLTGSILLASKDWTGVEYFEPTPAEWTGIGLGVLAFLLLIVALAWQHWPLLDASKATSVRLDRRGLHVRDESTRWTLVLSAERSHSRGPRHWHRKSPWLLLASSSLGLGGLPQRLLAGWASRAGQSGRLALLWDDAGLYRRIGRRLFLFWSPLLVVGGAAFLRWLGVPPKDIALGALVSLALLGALGAACLWMARQGRNRWAEIEREGLALLSELGW